MLKDVSREVRGKWRQGLVLVALLGFLALAAHQLGLPGLHYDEAKEAGLNAMQLVTWQPLSAFRDATVQVGPWRLPLMVQDYIGALNVLLATPFLALGGVNVPALRWLPLLIAALTLLITARVALRLGGLAAAAAAALLLAVNPSFVFWSRQGIFVTNLTALLFMASLLTGLRWWQHRCPRDLWLLALLWGLGVYAKLLFVWAIGAMVIVAVGTGVLKAVESRTAEASTPDAGSWKPRAEARRFHHPSADGSTLPSTSVLTLALALTCFLLPLIPLIVFNVRTSGTLISIFGNLGRSYYGVDNSAYLPNLLTRARQVVTLMRGDHFWYLGGVFANRWAPWLAAGLASGAALLIGRRAGRAGSRRGFVLPAALLALMMAQSAFTVSDLFITHYAMLLPLIPLAGGLAFGALWAAGWEAGRGGGVEAIASPPADAPGRSVLPRIGAAISVLALLAVLAWAGGDLWTTLRYHRALTASGGHAAHSDASYALADYLARTGPPAAVALDWGIDAPVRFLTTGQVNPVEIFGYERLDAADAAFAARAKLFLDTPGAVYLAHPAEETVFRGRVEALAALAAERGLAVQEEARFAERSGRPLLLVYRVEKTAN